MFDVAASLGFSYHQYKHNDAIIRLIGRFRGSFELTLSEMSSANIIFFSSRQIVWQLEIFLHKQTEYISCKLRIGVFALLLLWGVLRSIFQ